MKKEIVFKIYNLLQKEGLNWYCGYWWAMKDEWFKQFKPQEIDKIATEMAAIGMIETNGTGFRRKEKTLKEKIILKIWK